MSFQCLEPPLGTDKVNFRLGGLAPKPNPLATYGLGQFIGTDEGYNVVKTACRYYFRFRRYGGPKF